MVGRGSFPDLDLEDSLRLVEVVVVGAPSWASFLAAPLGPDSRVEESLFSAWDDDDVDDDEDATSATATSATSATTVSTTASLELSAGLEDGFQVGLWRPEEGDLVGVPAKLRLTRCSTGLEVGGVHRGERPS